MTTDWRRTANKKYLQKYVGTFLPFLNFHIFFLFSFLSLPNSNVQFPSTQAQLHRQSIQSSSAPSSILDLNGKKYSKLDWCLVCELQVAEREETHISFSEQKRDLLANTRKSDLRQSRIWQHYHICCTNIRICMKTFQAKTFLTFGHQ